MSAAQPPGRPKALGTAALRAKLLQCAAAQSEGVCP